MSCSIKFYENPINTAIPPCPCIHRGMREQSEFRFHIEARTFLNPFFGFYRPVAVQVRAEIPVTCYHFLSAILTIAAGSSLLPSGVAEQCMIIVSTCRFITSSLPFVSEAPCKNTDKAFQDSHNYFSYFQHGF